MRLASGSFANGCASSWLGVDALEAIRLPMPGAMTWLSHELLRAHRAKLISADVDPVCVTLYQRREDLLPTSAVRH